MSRIDRKTFLKGGLAALATGLSHHWASAPSKAASRAPAVLKRKRPNILLVMTDQERSWADLPADLAIPNRRVFAETATNFPNYHANAVACGPSRSVIYTGQHIQKTGVFDNPAVAPGRKDLDPKATPTIGAMLQDQGYHTAYIGKWHLHGFGERERNDMRAALAPFGFEEFYPATPEGDTDGAAQEGWKLDPALAGTAVSWLNQRKREAEDKPWFLSVNLINPHDIRHFDATGHQGDGLHPHFASELADAPDVPFYRADLGYGLPESFPGPVRHSIPAHRLYVEDMAYFFGSIPRDDTEAWLRYQNYYFNCVRDVDRHVGTILDGLKTAGLEGETIVIFTSDHGELAGAHGLRGKGPFLYKENFRVPLLIRHPDLARGVSSDALACTLDLAPTILGAAGVTSNERQSRYPALKGHNLLETAAGAGQRDGILLMSNIVHCCNPDKKRHIIETLYARDRGEAVEPFSFPEDFVNFQNRFFMRGFYDGRYKFGRYFQPDQHHAPQDWKTLIQLNDLELYDTVEDPAELTNLAQNSAYRDLILRLNNRLNELLKIEAGKDDGSFMSGPSNMWKR